MEQTQRLVWLDALRLTAGLSMVVLHATADPSGQPWVDYLPSERIWPIAIRTVVYSARTELFLIISVFLLLFSLEQRPRSYGQVMRQQMRRLLLPFAFWVLFYAGYNQVKASSFGYLDPSMAILTDPIEWIGFFVLGDIKYHMHFLPTLFGLILFYPLFEQARRAPALGVAILACLLVKRELDVFFWSNFYDAEWLTFALRAIKVFTYVGYGMVAGAAVGLYGRLTADQCRRWLPILLYTAALLAAIKSVGAYKTVESGEWQHAFVAGYWADFLMPAVLFVLCMFAGHLRWPSTISRIAPYSFGIYLCHPIFLDLAEILLRMTAWSPAIQVFVKIALVVPSTTLLVMAFSRSRLLGWTVGLGAFPGLRSHRIPDASVERKNAV